MQSVVVDAESVARTSGLCADDLRHCLGNPIPQNPLEASYLRSSCTSKRSYHTLASEPIPMPMTDQRSSVRTVVLTSECGSDNRSPWTLLPPRVESARIETGPDEDGTTKVMLVLRYAKPILGYVLLLLGLAMYVCPGPLLGYYPLELQRKAFILTTWRTLLSLPLWGALLLAFMFTGSLTLHEKEALRHVITHVQIAFFGLSAALAYGFYCACLTRAHEVMTAGIFSCLHPFLIVIYFAASFLFARCRRKVAPFAMPPALQLCSVVVAVIGLGLLTWALSMQQSKRVTIEAIVMGFLASVWSAAFLVLGSACRSKMPFIVAMFGMMVWATLWGGLISAAVEGTTFASGPTSLWRLFTDVRTFVVTFLSCVAYSSAQACFIGALKFLHPCVVSSAQSLEPVIALAEAVPMGHYDLPTPLGTAGSVIVMLSALLCGYLSARQDVRERTDVVLDITQAAVVSNCGTSVCSIPSSLQTPASMIYSAV